MKKVLAVVFSILVGLFILVPNFLSATNELHPAFEENPELFKLGDMDAVTILTDDIEQNHELTEDEISKLKLEVGLSEGQMRMLPNYVLRELIEEGSKLVAGGEPELHVIEIPGFIDR